MIINWAFPIFLRAPLKNTERPGYEATSLLLLSVVCLLTTDHKHLFFFVFHRSSREDAGRLLLMVGACFPQDDWSTTLDKQGNNMRLHHNDITDIVQHRK